MSFSDFHGNAETLHRLRDMLARERFPQAVILSGARGSGKYTLALMLAQALNCQTQPHTDGLPDFCVQCANCRRIAQSADLDARFAEAVEARDGLRETDKKDTRLFVQTHPDVLIIPPDPPQMMIKVDQVRRVIETDARMTPRLHHLADRELARMLRLQVRGNQADAHLEALERHARHDARALDVTAAGDAAVAVERAQQRRLAAAVVAVHQPPLPRAYRKCQAAKHGTPMQEDACVGQPHQRAARSPHVRARPHLEGRRRCT